VQLPIGKKDSAIYLHATDLLKELEDELTDCLEARNLPVAMELANGAD
jgi:hypothetical protein